MVFSDVGDGTKVAELKTKTANYHKRWYYFAAQWRFCNVLGSNIIIIFCDICCFSSV